MSESFDVVVIGAGPGGYVCAIRAAQLGLKVACVEKRATLGGTCLNVGCIPSKALLQSSEEFEHATKELKNHGVLADNVRLDLARMQKRKDEVVEANVKGVEFLLRKNKVKWLKGTARIIGPGTVAVEGINYATKNIIIATGSESGALPGVTVDERQIVTSTGALLLDKVPSHLIVIGAGFIGLELGSVWRRLGAEVTVIEFLDHIGSGMDRELSDELQRVLQKQGFSFHFGTKVVSATRGDNGVTVTMESVRGGKLETVKADVVLLSVGRRPFTEDLGLDDIGVELDDHQRVKVDLQYGTNVPGIYAIGDVIAGPMLAHKAEDEGVAVAEILAGQAGHVNYGAIPSVVYTWPEVAWVGQTEEELRAGAIAFTVGKFPFTANGRARAMGQTDGFVKILADKSSDRVLGGHVIGPDAGTLIMELTTAIEFGASAEDLSRISHAHPTLSEAIKEAALAAQSRPLHI